MSVTMIPANQREFRCAHCDGKILIPLDLPPTTGPCPHCGGVITSPDYEPPVAPVAAFQIPPPPVATPPPPAVVEIKPPPPSPEIPATPHPLAKKDTPKVELPPPAKVPEPKVSKKEKPAKVDKSKRSGLIPALLVLLLLGLVGAGVAYFASKELRKPVEPPTVKVTAGDPAVNEANYIRIGWQKDAYQLLRGYMAATDTPGKIPFILKGEQLAPKIEEFYGGGVILDSDTPAEAFSIYELSEEDRKRGLFMMIYDQPPQFDMKEFFRPLASLEVQYGVDEADLLLSTLARVGNFAMEPLRVHAFFKRTPDGLKLDWEIFAQTKYRTLQSFAELPEVGQSGVFRVFIVEDVPEKGKAVAGTRTYRMADPANTGDTARVNVKVDSETGRALSLINWRGTKENRPITRTATVELKWGRDAAAPELEISRFICWEFLGLGGQETPATASTK
ncbi:MAG: hypothetical protein RLZZ214_588 [Verrucomicrobiota bacterium]|jgi:hypothetical protein